MLTPGINIAFTTFVLELSRFRQPVLALVVESLVLLERVELLVALVLLEALVGSAANGLVVLFNIGRFLMVSC